jgi:hypothetical protein
MTDFFREVDEDVRRDRIIHFWQRYQIWIAGLIVLIIAGTGVWLLYDNFRTEAAQAAGVRYEAALRLLQEGKTDEAEAALNAAAQTSPPGYAALSRLLAAGLLAAKDPEAAIKAYEALAADANVAPTVQGAAQLRAAMLRVDRDDPKKFVLRFAPFAAAGHPYHSSYRELLALASFKSGDFEAAGRFLDEIVVDPQAPQGLRGRAQAFLAVVRAGKLPSQ